MFGNRKVLERLAAVEAQLRTLLEMNTPEGRQRAQREDDALREQESQTRDEIWEEYQQRHKAKAR